MEGENDRISHQLRNRYKTRIQLYTRQTSLFIRVRAHTQIYIYTISLSHDPSPPSDLPRSTIKNTHPSIFAAAAAAGTPLVVLRR